MLESLNTDVFEYEKLKPEEMQRRGILGRLVGVMADTVNPTRNGRSYSSELWENVFNNPIMKERIENNCCFGELGHPSDREETDMTKIAICMDGLPKKDKDGKLRAVFNILDTPNGRILKSLCDYGCNIGISSRGSGDLVTDFDGNESVDPDTYNCEGWDAVIIPAVKEARLTYVTEALEKKRYNKSLRDKLQEAINKETEDNKKIMTESLSCLGIRLNEEDSSDIGVEDKEMPDSDTPEPKTVEKEDKSKEERPSEVSDEKPSEEKDENDFFYKGIEIIKDPNSDKFVCEIEGDSYSFNSIKNAKIWVDINGGKSVTKSTDIKSLPNATQQDIENTLSKVLSSDSEVQKAMHGKLSDLDNLIDVNKYLTEEQVGRDEVKDDKNIDDVLKPETEEDKESKDDKDSEKNKDNNKVTVTITESIDWTSLNSTEQFAAESALSYIKDGLSGSNDIERADEIEEAVNDAVSMYNEANAFDEYSDEDFYEEEADRRKVLLYVLQELGLDEESNLDENLNKREDEEVADNIGTDIDSLQEMLEHNINLEKQIIELNEKLSVSHAMEKSLREKLRESKEKISILSKTAKENKVLTEQLKAAKDSTAKLNESAKQRNSKIKSLQEKLNTVIEERDTQATELTTLREDYELLTKDLAQTKDQFSKKFNKQNELLEKYQKVTKNAVDRYINMQATNLGVKPVEIKNKLSENFTFNEIDSVCEDLRDYKLNVSRLPFSASSKLNEGVSIKANNVNRNSLIPMNEADELTDYDLKLMEAYI